MFAHGRSQNAPTKMKTGVWVFVFFVTTNGRSLLPTKFAPQRKRVVEGADP